MVTAGQSRSAVGSADISRQRFRFSTSNAKARAAARRRYSDDSDTTIQPYRNGNLELGLRIENIGGSNSSNIKQIYTVCLKM